MLNSTLKSIVFRYIMLMQLKGEENWRGNNRRIFKIGSLTILLITELKQGNIPQRKKKYVEHRFKKKMQSLKAKKIRKI